VFSHSSGKERSREELAPYGENPTWAAYRCRDGLIEIMCKMNVNKPVEGLPVLGLMVR
jgi:hypothetical protein